MDVVRHPPPCFVLRGIMTFSGAKFIWKMNNDTRLYPKSGNMFSGRTWRPSMIGMQSVRAKWSSVVVVHASKLFHKEKHRHFYIRRVPFRTAKPCRSTAMLEKTIQPNKYYHNPVHPLFFSLKWINWSIVRRFEAFDTRWNKSNHKNSN